MRTKLVDAGYVILGDDLHLPLKLAYRMQELMGRLKQMDASETSIPIALTEMPLLDDPRLTSALFVDAQRPYVMVNKPEEYTDRVERKAANIKAPKLSWKEVYGESRSAGQLLQLEQ